MSQQMLSVAVGQLLLPLEPISWILRTIENALKDEVPGPEAIVLMLRTNEHPLKEAAPPLGK